MPALRVMTWNIASNRPGFAADAIAHGIDAFDPDVVALQEVCRDALKAVAKALRRRSDWPARGAGRGKVWHEHAGLHRARCGPFGNAIVGRIPLTGAAIGHLPRCEDCRDRGEERSVLLVRCDVDGAALRVASTHHSPGAWTRRAGQIEAALAFVGSDRSVALALCGDFNERPERLGLAYDRLVEADPERSPTYPAHDPTAKIDYLFVGGGAAAQDAEIPASFASDHRPLLATVTF